MADEYLSKLQLATWRAFLEAFSSQNDQIDRDLADAGCVSIASYDLLNALFEAPGTQLTADELLTQVLWKRRGINQQADRQAFLRLIDSLVAEALIDRPLEDSLALTPSGKEAVEKAWPIYAQGVARYFSQGMDEIETEHFEHSLHLMVQAVEKKAEPAEA
ncbi:hypothetical protein [Tengunoibacter tsumagoiensis]|uniref:HTH marR-type domain-containing protein n=1 Tax=Tengunoibacter tsumagoiensis TaxID=2014871 RepID=A0A402A9H3_9CHLR|nr:hypothetical protein [Tengunoibacter tsumagoiensis]GCE15812.1 hypothetical protein KTT_56710 [Tengunoibacter tsumagoiensis]